MKTKKNKTSEWKLPNNFQYSGVDYDYDTRTDCDSEGCCDSGICRCGKIYDARATSVDLNEVVRHIAVNEPQNAEFWRYSLYRLAVIHKIYEFNNWSINTCGGYYGEEIESVTLDNSSFEQDVIKLRELAPQDRIKFVLEKEYGFLLESLVGKVFIEKEVSVGDLVVGNGEYRKKVKGGTYTKKNYNLPIGIYLQDDCKYRLIDGYHRYVDLAAGDKTVEIISAE